MEQYDRTELLDRAIDPFRRQGLNGTSTAELVAVLDLNHRNMYAELGSKQGCPEADLERHRAHHPLVVLAPIEAPDAGTEAIGDAVDG